MPVPQDRIYFVQRNLVALDIAIMEPNDSRQSDGKKASSRMRKSLKTLLGMAVEAHEKAMASNSEIAKYNSGLLRSLERAFATNPEIDLLSKLPSHYSAVLEELRCQPGSQVLGKSYA